MSGASPGHRKGQSVSQNIMRYIEVTWLHVSLLRVLGPRSLSRTWPRQIAHVPRSRRHDNVRVGRDANSRRVNATGKSGCPQYMSARRECVQCMPAWQLSAMVRSVGPDCLGTTLLQACMLYMHDHCYDSFNKPSERPKYFRAY
jgi:hypothetical protein